jgi:hypothetical protein
MDEDKTMLKVEEHTQNIKKNASRRKMNSRQRTGQYKSTPIMKNATDTNKTPLDICTCFYPKSCGRYFLSEYVNL